MFDRNSLVAQLVWRLGIVLCIGTLLQMLVRTMLAGPWTLRPGSDLVSP